jgi:hypothetical protein
VSVSEGKGWTQAINAVSLSDKYAAYRSYATKTDGTGIYAEVCRTNQPMRLTQEELEAYPQWKGFGAHAAAHPAMRGWLAVPLIGRVGQNIGLIQASDKLQGEFTEEDEAILVQLASIAANGFRERPPLPVAAGTGPAQGRVPGNARPRVAQSARADLGGGGAAQTRDRQRRPHPAIQRRHRPPGPPPDLADRRPARCLARHAWPDPDRPHGARSDGPHRQCGGAVAALVHCARACAGDRRRCSRRIDPGRRQPPGPGAGQPPQQCGKVHAAGRTDCGTGSARASMS